MSQTPGQTPGVSARIASRGLIALSYGLGGAGLALFGLFLAVGPTGIVILELAPARALVLDALLSALFFAQHSAMVRERCQRQVATLVPRAFVPALFSVASGLALLLLVVLWQTAGEPVVAMAGWGRWVAGGAWLAAGGIMLWSWRALGSLDVFGARPIVRWLRGHSATSVAFSAAGPYRWVRHPMYLAALLMIWGHPHLTPDRLLFNVMWTLWIVGATRLEERDLVAAYGAQYGAYQARVPMLIPGRRSVGTNEAAAGQTRGEE